MPSTTNITGSTFFTIDPYVYSLYFKAYGASGGGEDVSTVNLTATNGTNGGTTTFLGFSLSGGQGGGVGGKNQGGNAGITTQTFDWSTVTEGVTIINPTAANAAQRGGLSNGGLGGLIDGSRNNGGSGSSGNFTYTSTATHIFNNETNTNIFTATGGAAMTINYMNPAAEGINGDRPINGKHYQITFVDSFTDQFWSYTLTHSQQAAGGSTGGFPYSYQGYRNKDATGFDIWFQTSGGGNTYIRQFTLNASGVKPGAQGRGGGGASAVEGIFTRAALVESVTYAPGETFLASIGTRGTKGGNFGGCSNGVDGEITVIETIYPQVYLSSNKLILKPSDPTATLTWTSAGDINAIRWPSNGDVTNANINSSATVSPTQTTTYTAEGYNTEISDLVSFNPEASVTIVVYQLPVIKQFSVTETLQYGSSGQISWEIQYANIGSELQIYYSWDEGPKRDNAPELVTTIAIDACASPEETGDDTQTIVKSSNGGVDGPIPYGPTWDTWGPATITYVLTATGDGGVVTSPTYSTTVTFDRTPENMDIPETEDLAKDQNPVFTTPDADVLSQLLLVDDIDIPVEIKANLPIEVQINDAGGFKKVREL